MTIPGARSFDARTRGGVIMAVVVVAAAVGATTLVAGRDATVPAPPPSSVVSVSDGGCDGVVVVVDPGAPGVPSVSCASGDPADGMTALRDAGHDLDLLTRDPRFVCRIDGRPADDPCTRFAPADAYWSSWRLEGSRWVYATEGAADTDPAPGDVEGWAFGAGEPPRVDARDLAGRGDRP